MTAFPPGLLVKNPPTSIQMPSMSSNERLAESICDGPERIEMRECRAATIGVIDLMAAVTTYVERRPWKAKAVVG